MSIRTEDRETVRRQVSRVYVSQDRDGRHYQWSCPHCLFCRTWGTESNAYTGAAQHLLVDHRIRLVLSPLHRPGPEQGPGPESQP